MTHAEDLEKKRQAVMRLRELLDHMRLKLDEGERAYARLFATFSEAEMRNTPEKEMQGRAAELLLTNPRPLENAILQMQFHARDLERAFEELYNIIALEAEP
jgi:hypothetical protein